MRFSNLCGTKKDFISNSAGNNGQEQQNVQHVASNAPSRRDECLTQPPQLELVGHSIVSVFSFRTILPPPPKTKKESCPIKVQS